MHNGKIKELQIVRDVGYGLGNEALELVKKYLSNWDVPGKQDEMNVNTIYNFPVNLGLSR